MCGEYKRDREKGMLEIRRLTLFELVSNVSVL